MTPSAQTPPPIPWAGMTTETATVVRLTDGALERILDLRSGETDGDSLALRIEVTGSNGSDYTYDPSFEPVDEIGDGHPVSVQGGLSVVVPDDIVDQLAGATLDLP